jgi:eukaryotic-like serine/threonine-protein kinase
MATVYRAHDERLDREVALKVLSPNLAADPAVAMRFEREARTLAAAAHPGVVSVYDVEAGDPATGREPFFVMELCPGGSLADRLINGQRMAPDELVRIVVSVADSLAGLHTRGFVHRDVKPSNILLTPDRAKLADFGLARSDAVPPSDLTLPGTVAGTLAYLAPEVLAGQSAGAAADVYALGVAAFAGLTGALPRPASSLAELITAPEPARRVSEVASDLGAEFDAPIVAALDREPAGRPDALRFASSLTTALGRWLRAGPPAAAAVARPASTSPNVDGEATTAIGVPVTSSPPTVRLPVPHEAPSGRRRARAGVGILAGVVVGVLAAIALLVFAGDPRKGTPPTPTVPNESIVATASPSPLATPSLVDRALVALDEVDAAIADTGGSGGLKGKDRNVLLGLASDVRSRLQAGDLDGARHAADELAHKVAELAKDLDEARETRLKDAVAALQEILNG